MSADLIRIPLFIKLKDMLYATLYKVQYIYVTET